MVYALVQSMTFMVDTIIAGHFLGTDAVAAIALGMPMIGLMLSFTGMILQGGFLKQLNAMGRNDMEDYHRFFSLALIFTVIVDCIFLALCIFGTNGVLAIAGAGKAAPAAVLIFMMLFVLSSLINDVDDDNSYDDNDREEIHSAHIIHRFPSLK